MELHCLRHGRTAQNAARIFQGQSDGDLLPEQIVSLEATDFDTSGYDVVYCSPLRRCRETAHLLGITGYRVEPRIAERDVGIFENLPKDECGTRYPDEYAVFRRLDAETRIPGGESRTDQQTRVEAWLEEAAGHTRVLAVTHGGVIDLLYRRATGGPMHGGDEIFRGANAALSIFDVRWPRLELISFSRELTPE